MPRDRIVNLWRGRAARRGATSASTNGAGASRRQWTGLRPVVLIIATGLVFAAAFVTADAAAARVAASATGEAARSAETVMQASVDPLLAGRPLDQVGPVNGVAIDDLMAQLVRPGGIQRIKLWSPTGTVVFSDLPALRGKTFEVEDDMRDAVDGRITSVLHREGVVEQENEFEGSLPADLLEMYLPLRASDGAVVGVYEIYEDASATVALIDETRRVVFVIASLVASALLVLLWLAFAATSRRLAAQNRRLVELASDLHGREARFRSLVQNSSDACAILGADGLIRYESVAVERMLGSRVADWEGHRFAELVHPDDRPEVEHVVADLASTPHAERRFECRLQHADGTWRTMEAVGRNLLEDAAVAGLVINHRDVTERKSLEAELIRQAFHDHLTGLPNRALFGDRVAHALNRRRRGRRAVGVLFIDLDDFKAINDSLGHETGDRVLQEVAERLRTTARPGDTVARLGGDEFAFLLEDVADAADVETVAERVEATLGEPLSIADTEVTLRVSIGIADATDDDQTAADLLRDADVAMYLAKARGGGHERFLPEMREAAVARFELGTDLRRAIEREEFVLHYQPVVDLASGGVLGFEALVRWQHPTRGLLPPLEFIPVAEATGLIVPIGRWVVEEACRQAKRWQDAFPSSPALTMSANLSARELREASLVDNVAAILERTGVDPVTIILEITETSMVEDADGSVGTLQALKALGVRIAIDDFGTGYSSLNYLRRLPVDVLKLDRSFVATAGRGEREAALVDAVFRLGRTLGLDTVVEGVEDREQRERLVSLGCRIGQGYLFARPMAEPAASDWLRSPGSGLAQSQARPGGGSLDPRDGEGAAA
jgi:diguanylate cyclase (GGDEF)-like protein/PAS domain S-box-containing protein